MIFYEYDDFQRNNDDDNSIPKLRDRGAGGLLWHYTRLKSFYDVIKTDGFWATNARFSNDEEELTYIKNIAKGAEVPVEDVLDTYIVSLCTEGDLLSQWRGYCGENEGVAIGLDIHFPKRLYLRKTEDMSSKSSAFFNIANEIIYDKNKAISELKERYRRKTSAYADLQPYFKHPKFEEELEYRLAVVNENGKYDDLINYRMTAGRKIPYVEIMFGDMANVTYGCCIRINIGSSAEQEIFDKVKTSFALKAVVRCRLSDDERNTKHTNPICDDSVCFGCTTRRFDSYAQKPDIAMYCRYGYQEMTIVYTKNEIRISEGHDQKDVFRKVSGIVDEYNKELHEKLSESLAKTFPGEELEKQLEEQYKEKRVSVWCEGHLPIRAVCVGNARRKEELAESIKHFCERGEHYWLKYVEVTKSEIPFRSQLGFLDT